MWKILTPVLVAVALAPSAYAMDANGNFRVKGYGLESCASFIASYEAQDGTALYYLNWTNGYISAVNQFQPDTYDVAGSLSIDDLGTWLVAYCRENGGQTMITAVSTMMAAMYDQRLTYSAAGEQGAPAFDPGLVRDVQQALSNHGYYDSTIDGLYGPGTRQAIVTYQKTENLPITGLPDLATTLKLLN